MYDHDHERDLPPGTDDPDELDPEDIRPTSNPDDQDYQDEWNVQDRREHAHWRKKIDAHISYPVAGRAEISRARNEWVKADISGLDGGR